ncbi:MAG: ATP-binding protein [Spirochaetes bacterium]|jgi:two-component system sensor histidine kinase/response regulator|nr:ATP-binding protein [Spirochaetota bacterium]
MHKNRISILIADDEEKILTRLERILVKEGYTVGTASDGSAALRRLAGERYDIVLTDINMPDKNGFEVMEFIKNERLDTLPLVLTGYASVESAIRAMKLGAYDFIQKPVDAETLKLIIFRAAERVILKRENEQNMLELKKLNDLKDEFLSVVSHDLRSPLSSIGGYASYLLKKGQLSDTQRSYLLIIREIADNLYSLVNELLDISKIEAGVIRLTMEEADLGELISTSINNFILLASDKNTAIHFHSMLGDPRAVIDRMKILQVVNNLINNAVKFTENGVIDVTAHRSDDGKAIVITVRDTGTGMTADALQNIFEKYSFFSSEGTRGEGGTGLGLVICKRFIELHGGTIEAESAEGNGSIFRISIPQEKGK